jgi:hypothetical protein
MSEREPATAPEEQPVIELERREPANTVRWDFINRWQVIDQSNDRRPLKSRVATGSGPKSAQRSIARRAHQASHKEWSSARHD